MMIRNIHISLCVILIYDLMGNLIDRAIEKSPDIHIAALNSGSDWHTQNTLKLVDAQVQWLENDIKASQAKWKIVFIHQGVYPAKEERAFGLRDSLEKTLQDNGVDLVLQGHDHMIGRTYPVRDGEPVSKETHESIEKGEGIVY